MMPQPPSVVIENLTPLVEGGRYPIKRVTGEDTTVEADIYEGGHDVASALLTWRKAGAVKWHGTPLTSLLCSENRSSAVFRENPRHLRDGLLEINHAMAHLGSTVRRNFGLTVDVHAMGILGSWLLSNPPSEILSA